MKRGCFVLGVAVLALVWFGPLLAAWRDSFAAHMLAHMGVVAIAAPLIAVGIGTASFYLFSERKSPTGVTETRPKRCSPAFLFVPMVASVVELIVVWGWHAPAARAWVQNSTFAIVLEQATFLGAGLLLWLSCLASGSAKASAHRAAGAFGLLLTTVHMTLLGALLALSPRPLYGLGEVTCFGLTLNAAQDQQLGAVIMLFVGAAVYLAGGVTLLARLLALPVQRAA